MNYLRILLVAVLVVSFTACDESDEVVDNTVLLTKKTWTFSSLTGYDDFSNAFISAFFTDMTYQFKTDGTYSAVILTIPTDGTWTFNTDETVITLEPGTADAVDWTIVTLTDTELTISSPDADALTGTFTMTFK